MHSQAAVWFNVRRDQGDLLKKGLHETQTKTQKNPHYLVRRAHKSV